MSLMCVQNQKQSNRDFTLSDMSFCTKHTGTAGTGSVDEVPVK